MHSSSSTIPIFMTSLWWSISVQAVGCWITGFISIWGESTKLLSKLSKFTKWLSFSLKMVKSCHFEWQFFFDLAGTIFFSAWDRDPTANCLNKCVHSTYHLYPMQSQRKKSPNCTFIGQIQSPSKKVLWWSLFMKKETELWAVSRSLFCNSLYYYLNYLYM